jgi:hypothetical protein
MPKTYATRAKWEKQFIDVCTATKAQQGSTLYQGLWTTSMLDHQQWPDPETSGSAFFCFAMMWGVNNHILDSTSFIPCVKKAWTDLVANVNAQGMLLRCQNPSAAPNNIPVNLSSREGEGAFMLSGEELVKWAQGGTSVPRPQSSSIADRTHAQKLKAGESGISFFLNDPRRSLLRIYDLKGTLLSDCSGALRRLRPGDAFITWEALGISGKTFVVSFNDGAGNVPARVVMSLHAR